MYVTTNIEIWEGNMAKYYGAERKLNINVRCDVTTKQKLESLAKLSGLSQADVIEELLIGIGDKWLRNRNSLIAD